MKIRRIIVTSFRVMGSGSGYNWVVVFAAARVGVHLARTERLETASAHKLRCWCTAIVAVSFTQHLMQKKFQPLPCHLCLVNTLITLLETSS